MRCPDWNRLRSRQENDPEAWERGLEHFDACDQCRDQALAVEPTLMFRRLPAPVVGKSDVEAMKQAVAVLRRSEERRSSPTVDRSSTFGLPAVFDLPVLRRHPQILRAAALVALMVGAAALQGDRQAGPMSSPVAEVESFDTELPSSAFTLASTEVAGAPEILDPRLVDDLPLVEANDPTYGSVVQVVDDEISLLLLLPNDA
jgi:hypothetical protein